MKGQGGWLQRSLGVLSTSFGILADVYVILFLGIFITAQPSVNMECIGALFPLQRWERAREVLDTLGSTL